MLRVSSPVHRADSMLRVSSPVDRADIMLRVSTPVDRADSMLRVRKTIGRADSMLRVNSHVDRADSMLRVSRSTARANSTLQVIPVRIYKYSLLLVQLEEAQCCQLCRWRGEYKKLILLVEFCVDVWTFGNTVVLPTQNDCFVTNN